MGAVGKKEEAVEAAEQGEEVMGAAKEGMVALVEI